MPYKYKAENGKHLVINTETDEVRAQHETKEAAERQIRILHELEKEETDG